MSDRVRRHGQPRRRRLHPRWRVDDGRLTGPVLIARVLDVGPAGARVETTRALRVGAPYAFTLELSGASRRLRGRVRWCRLVATRADGPDEQAPVYRAGIHWMP